MMACFDASLFVADKSTTSFVVCQLMYPNPPVQAGHTEMIQVQVVLCLLTTQEVRNVMHSESW